MLLDLVLKEFKSNSSLSKLTKRNIIGFILNIVLAALFVSLEIVLFKMFNAKLAPYKGAQVNFLVIFLSLISLANIVFLIGTSRKSVFNEYDNRILINKPVSPFLNISSKMVFIYMKDFINNLVIALPILIMFGVSKYSLPKYYVLACLYPILVSFFETGISLLLTIPYEKAFKYLRSHLYVQLAISVVIVICLCFAYSFILNAFLALVRDNNIESIFSKDMIASFETISMCLVPINFYVTSITGTTYYIVFFLLINLLIFGIGCFTLSSIYLKLMKKDVINKKQEVKSKEIKLVSPERALIEKEIRLYFEDSTSVVSSFSLLIVEPFLTVLVIKAMNTIFGTGVLSYVSNYFPYLISLIQILFVALFATFINNSSSFVISREKKEGIRICKTMPVSYKKQVYIKLMIPFVFSFFSLLITVITLMATRDMLWSDALLSFLLSLGLIALLQVISVQSDIKHPNGENENNNSTVVITFVAILTPVIITGLMFLLNYLSLNYYASFFICFGVIALLFAVLFTVFNKKVNKDFLNLEMRN